MLFQLDQNPTCPGSRTCLRTCTCSSRESAVSCLVSLYNYQLEKDDDEVCCLIQLFLLEKFYHFN